jgi:hypothetical protein
MDAQRRGAWVTVLRPGSRRPASQQGKRTLIESRTRQLRCMRS